VHGERDGGDRDEPGERHARRHRDGGGLGGRRELREPVDRQGGDRLHANGGGWGRRDERGVQHHGGDGDAAGVLGAAEHDGGGGGDHAGGTGDGAGCAGEHGDRVHGERHGGDRDEPGERHADRHRDGGGLGRRRDVREPGDRQGGHRLH